MNDALKCLTFSQTVSEKKVGQRKDILRVQAKQIRKLQLYCKTKNVGLTKPLMKCHLRGYYFEIVRLF